MDAPIGEWGRRLSAALRSALASGDFVLAQRLAREGDGQARSLAKEFTFMYRGLGITIRVLLPLLRETALRADAANRDSNSAPAAAALLNGFRSSFTAAMQSVWSDLVCASASPGTLEEEIACTARALEAGESRFEQEQARLAEAVIGAIEARDAAGALLLLNCKEQDQYQPLHDRLIRFMADSFGWVLQRFGTEELMRFHLATAEGQRRGIEKWEGMSAAEFAWTSVFLLKQHLGQVSVREDELKFTIDQAPCGSGGRLQLAAAYAGPGALPFVESPGALTFGQPRLPVYCSHCAVWNGVATLQWFGRAHWVFENAARADGGCTMHIYKRREDAPAEYSRLLMAETAQH